MKKGIKVVTIGGGSSYTPELIAGFIKRYDALPISELWLVDVEEGKEKLEINTKFAKRMLEHAGIPIKVISTLQRKEALKDADFVTTQFRVGQLGARIIDERIPLKYDTLGQETNGAGGMMKAFRTIPQIIEICKDIEEVCPDAWLINYTNPSGMVTEAIHRYSNVKKVIGLCSGPLGIKQDIAKLLSVDAERLYVEFVGLNHLVFAKKVLFEGRNVTKEVMELFIKGIDEAKLANIAALPWDTDFIRELGMIPIDYLKYYFKTPDMLKHQQEAANAEGTRAEVVKDVEEELFEIYQDEALVERPELLKRRGGAWYSEAATDLMVSLYTDARDIHTLNVRNNGAIRELPDDVVVEVNCLVTSAEVIPLTTGHLPTSINGIIQQIKSVELTVVEAAATGDYNKALLAFTMNPLISSDRKAKEMLDEMLEYNKKHLPLFFSKERK